MSYVRNVCAMLSGGYVAMTKGMKPCSEMDITRLYESFIVGSTPTGANWIRAGGSVARSPS